MVRDYRYENFGYVCVCGYMCVCVAMCEKKVKSGIKRYAILIETQFIFY